MSSFERDECIDLRSWSRYGAHLVIRLDVELDFLSGESADSGVMLAELNSWSS